ncbi:helix-turn-helix domain-containing protein [Clostridium sp. P21]|uniref:Helix-turn-helix domain-containing protein n=1 Tax=Clostridium muellerianum TaxID=2716538 RepID=A0A7Y0ELC1_9CLOT|nr:helix-turn-helix domain-containing protein [Clostridium muellerianum]NMM65526.1 helix-turn-helix domain-containing protein [Clostridium muellerianum]
MKELQVKQEQQELQCLQEAQDLQEKLLRPQQAAAMLCITTETLREWYHKGVLTVVITYGGHMRIPASEIYRLLNRKPHDRHALYKEPLPPEAYAGFEEEPKPRISDVDFFEKMINMRKFLQKQDKSE